MGTAMIKEKRMR